MTDQTRSDLFPAVLRQPSSLGWVAVLPSLALALVNAFCFWLVWGEMKGGCLRAYAGVLIALSALPALEGALAMWVGRRRSEGVPTWAHLLIAVLCAVQLVAFCCLIDKALPRPTPEWVIGPSFCLAQFALMMPGLFVGLWRVAGVPLGLAPLADFGVSLLMTFLPPAVLYVGVAVVARLLSWRHTEFLGRAFIVSLLIVGPVILFLGLLRCLMIIRRFFVQRGSGSRAYQMGYVGAVALVLPIAGLFLNKAIPFPADFQNPWPYALTAVNAAALMMPPTGRARIDAAVRALRLMLFPFVVYFFVVFLPFLPFSIIAILAMGTGFLVLAPTLLFMVQGQILRKDFEDEAARAGRGTAWAKAALGLLVLPGVFAARAEFDRWALHRALDFRYAPDYRQESRLGVPPAAVRRVLLNVRCFKDGAELPYLANWYNARVFDNLLLQDEKADELWRLIVGGQPPKKVPEDLMRNAFASLFGGKTRSPGAPRGRAAARVPPAAALDEVQSSCATTNGETVTRVRLKVSSHDVAGPAEYVAKLSVPPGVWVSGFRLKIGGEWAVGRVVERKAAEWVYRQIRDASRRDPALLRYEPDGSLSLRVFPVSAGEPREVEIDFLCPEGFADAVAVGDRLVALGDGRAAPQCVWAEGVWACNGAWRWPEGAALSLTEEGHLVLDCSAGAAWTEASLAQVLARARPLFKDPRVTVTLANYETRTVAVSLDDAQAARQILAHRLPVRGAFDAGGALRRLARQFRERSGAGNGFLRSPRIVLAGVSAGAALAAVKTESWQAFGAELPEVSSLAVLGAEGAVSEFPVPRNASPADGPMALCAGGEVRRTAGGGSQVVFTGGADAPRYWNARSGAFEALPGLVARPPGSRWGRGAAAWRLQREWDENPSREDLRRPLLKASRESGVLTPLGSYIVVENSMQWKMLEVKQWQTVAGDAALDLIESPAPGWLPVLSACVLFGCFFARIRRRKA